MLTRGVAGLVPVAHSRSPAMQNAAFARARWLDWRYVKLPVPPELFDETVRALPGSGFRGANVTIPHKLRRARAGRRCARAAAAAIGAANTLTFARRRDRGATTPTRRASSTRSGRGPATGKRALVLGAGGAGARRGLGAARGGRGEVPVWNRTPERAAALAAELGVSHAERPRPCDLLVNATSVGLEPRWRAQMR